MNETVSVRGREYPLAKKRYRLAGGYQYERRHVKLTVATDYHSGRQIQHDYTGITSEEVQRKIDASLRLSDAQLRLQPEEITVAALTEQWLSAIRFSVLGETLSERRDIFRVRVFPWFGDLPARRVTAEQIGQWQRELYEAGRTTSYVNLAFSLLSQVMDYGCAGGHLSHNPCRYARLYTTSRPDQSILNPDQLQVLLVREKEHPFAPLFALTLLLGLRLSEALGLSWAQVDLQARTVRICQQLSPGREVLKRVKNGRPRTLLMPASALPYLERQRLEQERQKSGSPSWNNPDNLVFTDSAGRGLSHAEVWSAFRRMMEGTSNPGVSVHGLRRTAASVLAENHSLHAVSYYLGHAEMRTSLKYVYPAEKDLDHLVRQMGEYYGRLLTEAQEF